MRAGGRGGNIEWKVVAVYRERKRSKSHALLLKAVKSRGKVLAWRFVASRACEFSMEIEAENSEEGRARGK